MAAREDTSTSPSASSYSVEHRLQERVAGILADVEKDLIRKLSETTIAEVGHA